MKILFLTENFPPENNAAATRVFERACYWVNWGHDVTIITCAPNFPQGKLYPNYKNSWHQVEMISGMRVVRVKTFIAPNKGTILRSLDFLSFLITGVGAGLFQNKPDLIVATSPQFFAAVAGWTLGVMRRLPFVFELGDLWPASIAAVGAMRKEFLLRIMEKVELYLYRESAAVVALTNAFKNDLTKRGIDGDKIAVVMNGIDLPRYEPRPQDIDLATEWDLNGYFVIGYVGTHGMAHGLRNVLNAAGLLQDIPELRFLLVGAGAEREQLFEEARNRRLNNIVFLPPQPKEKMPAVWSLCNVALIHLKNSPIFADVIPSKIFEAMGMGLPLLLAAPEGEASRIIATDKAGIWVPAENPEALAEAALTMMKDKETLKSYSRCSLRAAPLHSREHQARLMINVLEKVMRGEGHKVGSLPLS